MTIRYQLLCETLSYVSEEQKNISEKKEGFHDLKIAADTKSTTARPAPKQK